MQSLARLAKERHVNASRTQLSKQVLFQTNHHHVHTPDEEGDDGDASPSMSWRLVVSTHSRVYEHSHSFTTCLWTQTASFIYHMSMNTNSTVYLPHVHEHNQCHSFTTCFWTQLQHLNFSLHTEMACNSFITVFIRFCCRSESQLVNFHVHAECSNSCVTNHYFTAVWLWDQPSYT